MAFIKSLPLLPRRRGIGGVDGQDIFTQQKFGHGLKKCRTSNSFPTHLFSFSSNFLGNFPSERAFIFFCPQRSVSIFFHVIVLCSFPCCIRLVLKLRLDQGFAREVQGFCSLEKFTAGISNTDCLVIGFARQI